MEEPSFLKKPEYPTYRNPQFERFINGFRSILADITLCGFCIVLVELSNILALIFLFIYYLVQRMPENSIYFFDNKGIGPNWKTILKEDICHSIRHSAVTFLCVYGVLAVMKMISGETTNETGIQRGVEHSESNQVSCVSTNLPSGR